MTDNEERERKGNINNKGRKQKTKKIEKIVRK